MRVQVHLRAEKLGNIARGRWRGGKSNPYAVVSLASGDGENGGSELGKTEVIRNNLSPKWTTIFIVEHDTNQKWTPLKIKLYDSRTFTIQSKSIKRQEQHDADNNNDSDLDSDDDLDNRITYQQGSSGGVMPLQALSSIFTTPSMMSMYKDNDPMMGSVDVEVSEILSMEGRELKIPLDEGGFLYVHITESMDAEVSRSLSLPAGKEGSLSYNPSGTFHCRLRGLDLKNIETGFLGLGAIDPYYEISKKYWDPSTGSIRWITVYRSEHKGNIINPYWSKFSLSLEKLCHSNIDMELRIAVLDYQERTGRSDRPLGEVRTSVSDLQNRISKYGNAGREDALKIENDEGEEIGLIVVLKAEIR